jgi:hypothetical protein
VRARAGVSKSGLISAGLRGGVLCASWTTEAESGSDLITEESALGIRFTTETINVNMIEVELASAIQSGSSRRDQKFARCIYRQDHRVRTTHRWREMDSNHQYPVAKETNPLREPEPSRRRQNSVSKR